jgi:flagellum-specific ATP synthase
VLSRSLAHANHYPAIDVLESVSRLTRDICKPAEVELAARAREHLALYKRNEDLITVGAYQKGASAALDRAVALHDGLKAFLRQSVDEVTVRATAYTRLAQLLGPA